jgi:hypothetical protein
MRDKVYKAIRDNKDAAKTIDDADPGVRQGIEAGIRHVGSYPMRCPDMPCATCLVNTMCQTKTLYDLGDLDIAKAAALKGCEKIELWTEIVKCEKIKERFLEECNKRRYQHGYDENQNYNAYLAMCIANYARSEKFNEL